MVTAGDLHWLPVVADFNHALREVQAHAAGDGGAWAQLAGYRLDFMQTAKLDRAMAKTAGQWQWGRPLRLAVLASATVDHLLPALRVAALRWGFAAEIYLAPFGQYRQEILDPGSALHAFSPDVVLLALDAQTVLPSPPLSMPAAEVAAMVQAVVSDLRTLWAVLAGRGVSLVLQQDFLPVDEALFGALDAGVATSPARLCAEINQSLALAAAETPGVALVGLSDWARRLGVRQWHDPVLWHRAKQDIVPPMAPLYADLVLRVLAAGRGLGRKCLVLDLDNTLWGGVIGDDGLDGIVLGQGNGVGEAYCAFQRYAKTLSERGIMLAVCSKNTEFIAREAFDQHPDMILRSSDILCFKANWTDKATNLRAIAAELNIGIDSLVFVDDNPAERQLIRSELPEVAVPELPVDPAYYVRCVADSGLFETVLFTAEDGLRTAQYQANVQRQQLQQAATDMDAYLQSLNMSLNFGGFDELSLPRVAQLVNKTNQFNLTTRRYSEAELAELAACPRVYCRQARLLDRFGDNGLIAVLIAVPTAVPTIMRVDTWLMSCRVLGRQVEQAMMAQCCADLRAQGVETLLGQYLPTAKNAMVAEHFRKLGFDPAETPAGVADEGQWWSLTLAEAPHYAHHITITGTPS